jgi:hypothetical protein
VEEEVVDNHNNLPPEDNPVEEEVEEAVEAAEVAEANQQQDNKLQDKQQLRHLVQNLSKE